MSRQNQQKSNKLVDIVILVHGRFDLLSQCLKALPEAADGIEYNVILIDNDSPEKEVAREFYSHLDLNYSVIYNKENIGFPAGCNQGARRKTSPLLLMLNSDVILYPQAISKMVTALDNPLMGVVGAKLLFPTQEQLLDAKLDHRIRPAGMVQHVGLETNIRGEFYHIFIGWSSDHPKVNRMRETYAVTGACLMTRRSLWNKIGGFFEGYGQGTFEDIDYCLAIRDMSFGVIVETEAVGVHYTGATTEAYQKPYPLNMNRMVFMQRWGNKLNYSEHERL